MDSAATEGGRVARRSALALLRHALVGLLAASGCASGCPTHGGPVWREVVSEHFVLRTPLSLDQARTMALDLERTLEALVRATYPRQEIPRQRIEVIAVDDLLDYFQGGRALIAGWFSRSLLGEKLVLTTQWQARRVMVHELAHYVSGVFMPRQPRWLAEGLASWLETLEVEPGSAVIGQANGLRLRYLREGWSSLGEVLNDRALLTPGFYSAAWLIVDYLLNARGDDFLAFQRRLRQGRGSEAAFRESFPDLVANGALAAALTRHAQAGVRRGRRVTFTSTVRASTQERVLAPTLAHVSTAWLYLHANRSDRHAQARVLAERALADDPRSGDAHLLAVMTASDEAGALEAARRAVAAVPDDWRLWALRGTREPEPTERREALARALVLQPDSALVHAALSSAELERGQLTPAEEHARRAVALDPRDPGAVLAYALVAFALRRCEDAGLAAERLAELTIHAPPTPAQAARLADARKACDAR